jgi:putative glycosyltransferase (TIGR04372 family)
MQGRLGTLVAKVRAKGLFGTLRSVVRHARNWSAQVLRRGRDLLGRMAFASTVLLMRLLRVRFLADWTWQPSWAWLGHLAMEPDCFIKEGRLGLRPRIRGVILVRADRIANRRLLDYWRRYLWVFTSPFWCRVLEPFAAIPSLRWSVDPYVNAINRTGRFAAIQAGWGNLPPLLRLTRSHIRAGEARLHELGIPAGAWFICVHCREGGYDSHFRMHALRNVRIEDYIPALEAIVARGGWCVRLGDPSMKPLPPLRGVIDYVHSPLRCDWMDVFLCARAKFLLGSASGPTAVASVFGVPGALPNLVLPSLAQPFGVSDLLIPKLLWSPSLGRHLTFPEIAASPFANARFTHCYEFTDVQPQDSTPEDVRDLALELLDEIDGRLDETPDDRRLQAAYQALIQPGNYSHGAVSRIGRRFLRKYRHLLETPAPEQTGHLGMHPGCGTPACPCQVPGWKPQPTTQAA